MKRIIKYLPQKLKRIIKASIKYSPTKQLDIKRINLIRNLQYDYLRKQEEIEKLLCDLGLNDEELFNYPETLLKYCGQGMFSWQYPIQFGKYLIELSKHKINSYLEIGVKHGGTFIITVEYLKRFNKLKNAIGIDLFHARGLKEYKKYNIKSRNYALDSRSNSFKKLLEKQNSIDLVLIDGDHSYEGCKSDFLTVKKYSKMIAFHDIVGTGVPGVVKFWKELKENYNNEYVFFEFIDQYTEVLEKTGNKWLGIGLAIKK